MQINWAALGSTFGVSVLVTLAVVGAFCLGISALSRHETAVTDGGATGGGGARGAVALGTAVLCFTLCAGVVGYGLYIIALS
jgi:hypothetical protein